MYDDLARVAEHVLKDGGSLLCMIGQSFVPEIITALTARLKYHWVVGYLTPGGQAVQVWDRRVNTFWKPVLWFTKGAYAGEWVDDLVTSKVQRQRQEPSPLGPVRIRHVRPYEAVCEAGRYDPRPVHGRRDNWRCREGSCLSLHRLRD